MRSKNQYVSILAVIAAMLLLILDPKSALLGARDGIDLCIRTVIPSLFPFIVLSIMLTGLLLGQNIPFLHRIGYGMHLPQNSEIFMLIGFLGGYPVGAQNIVQAYKDGVLSKNQAERMLPFCNNAGPAFIFGIGSAILDNVGLCFLAWFVQIISAISVACISANDTNSVILKHQASSISLTDALNRSIRALSSICGWIVLFRMIIAYSQQWLFCYLPTEMQVFLLGVLELSNGCCEMNIISSRLSRFTMFSVLLSFGGICVLLQTKSILSGTELSFHSYFPGKICQSSISYLICYIITFFFPDEEGFSQNLWLVLLAVIFCICFRIFSKNTKKNIAFPPMFMYNNRQTKYGGHHTYESISQKS